MSHGDEIKRIFDDPLKFAIDAGIEVVGAPDNVARLVQNPQVTFAALYNGGTVDADLSRDGGSLVGTPTGGASTDGLGNLDLTGGTVQFVSYDPTDNVDQLVNVGAARVKFIPNYSGSPADQQQFFDFSKSANQGNRIFLRHSTAGGTIAQIRSNNGTVVFTTDFGQLVAVAGTEVELEFNWDLNGVSRLFIDGTQKGSAIGATGTRMAGVDVFIVGASFSGGFAADMKIAELAIFDSVQHTADYVPASTGLLFPKDNPTIKSASTTLVTGVLTAARVASIDNPLSLDLIKHVVEIDGQFKFFNGAAWVDSDLSTAVSRFSDSNLIEELTPAALALLPLLELGSLLRLDNVFHSEDGLTTPLLTSTTLGVEFLVPDHEPINECIINGHVFITPGIPDPGAVVFIDHAGFLHGKTFIDGRRFETVAAEDGSFQLQVPQTATIPLNPYTLGLGSRRYTNVSVPDQGTCTLEDLNLPATPA